MPKELELSDVDDEFEDFIQSGASVHSAKITEESKSAHVWKNAKKHQRWIIIEPPRPVQIYPAGPSS